MPSVEDSPEPLPYSTGGVLPSTDEAANILGARFPGIDCAPLRPEAIECLGGAAALERLQELAGRARAAQHAVNDLGAGKPSPEASERVSRMLAALDTALIPTDRPIVGIGGWMTSGKDALANFLVRNHGYAKTFMSEALTEAVTKLHPQGGPWVRLDSSVRVSGALRASAGSFMRYAELVELVGYEEAKTHSDARAYLQGLGTEVGRDMIGENTWVIVTTNKILELHNAGPVVVTGIRYPNELKMIHDLGGHAVWVTRPGIDAPPSTHTSETSLSEADFDMTIHNDGSLDDLRHEAERLHGYLVTL